MVNMNLLNEMNHKGFYHLYKEGNKERFFNPKTNEVILK